MSAEHRFRRLQQLFDQALELPEIQRAAFVAEACDGDAGLEQELLRLLARESSGQLISDDTAAVDLEQTLRRALPAAFVEGQQLGPFRIIEPLGGGGMGRVYRAIRNDGAVEQEVAVKLVRPDLFNSALGKRLSEERRLLAALDHPNICRFLDAGELADGSPYVVMEFVRGRPLLQYCEELRLTLEQRVQLIRKVCAAVDHAHRNLIVHRDIKSDNILVTDDGEPKLLDFGIGKSLGGDLQATQTAERFLTPSNAAPEQLRGEPTGTGCDIYALGLLLFELLVGRPAFELAGKTAGEIEREILLVPPPPPSQIAAEAVAAIAQQRGLPSASALAAALRGDLDAIITTCLRKDTHERYASIGTLDRDLGCYLYSQPIGVRHGDRRYRLRKFVARHRLAVAMTIALASVIVSALVLTGWLALDLAEQRNRALVERDRAAQALTLLSDAFAAADPAGVAGANVTAREILDAARPRIESVSETQPAVYAPLAAAMADVHYGLSLYAESLLLAESAEAALLRSEVHDPELLRRLLMCQARSATALGRPQQTDDLLVRIRALDGSEPAIDWMVARGGVHEQFGEYDEAVALLRHATTVTQAAAPNDETATAARWLLAKSLSGLGQHDGARSVLEETLAWQQRLGSEHPRLSLTRLRLVEVLSRAGSMRESLEVAEAAVQRLRAAYGDESALTARALAAAATAAHMADEHNLALQHYEQAIAVGQVVLDRQDPRLAMTLYNFGLLLESKGELESAQQRIAEAVMRAEASLGPHSNRTFFMRLGLARVAAARGDWAALLVGLAGKQSDSELERADADNLREFSDLLQRALEAGVCESLRHEPSCAAAKRLQREAEAILKRLADP